MRKRFAPLALLFGLLTATLLASTSMAQANTIYPNFVCTNGPGVGVVTCIDSVNNIKVTIKTGRILTDNELTILKYALNKTEIEKNCEVTIQKIKVLVVNVYNSFNPPITITVDNVTVWIVSMICY